MNKSCQAPAGFIFGCTQETISECLSRCLFGLPPPYMEMVEKIKPTAPLFLFDFHRRELHGGFEAASFGGCHLDKTAFKGRFPCQVRVRRAQQLESVLHEDVFRETIKDNYYSGHRFRYELSAEQVRRLQGLFWQQKRFSSLPKRGQNGPENEGPPVGKRPRVGKTVSKALPSEGTMGPAGVKENVEASSRASRASRVEKPEESTPVNYLSVKSFVRPPANRGLLAARTETRTTVVVGPLPTDLAISQLIEILDSCGLEGLYNFLYVTKVVETRHRYCFLNVENSGNVHQIIKTFQRSSWSRISGTTFAENPVVKVAFWSLQGPEDLVREFGSGGQWELGNVGPRDSASLTDDVPYFFYGFGDEQRSRLFPSRGQDLGSVAERAILLEKLLENIKCDISQHCLQLFNWREVACDEVKTEDGQGNFERIKANAMLYFRQDLDRIMDAIEKQDKEIARALKSKYRPLKELKDTDSNYQIYEGVFRVISEEIDNRIGHRRAGIDDV